MPPQAERCGRHASKSIRCAPPGLSLPLGEGVGGNNLFNAARLNQLQ